MSTACTTRRNGFRAVATARAVLNAGSMSRSFSFDPTRVAALAHLAPRECQVLSGLVGGRSYKQIAADLGVSIDTVRTYIRSLYRKLDVHSATEAIVRALALAGGLSAPAAIAAP